MPGPESVRGYLDAVEAQIRWKRARTVAARELETHLEEQQEEFLAEGHPPEEAERLAVEDMGDPVAVGALTFRTRFCHQILALKPAAIRGNASEILALAGMSAGGRGVDTTDTAVSAVPAAQALARQTNTIVAVTGEIDYITDGQRTRTVAGGDPLMTRVVGTGCALSAVVAACCSLPGDRLDNVAAACGWMKLAGTIAVTHARGPGSFASAFLDALDTLEEQA